MDAPFTILVVDDVPANIGVLLDALSTEFRLLVAENAESCLEQLPHAQPDLMLLDVRMPGISGFALFEQLKAHPQWAAIPVIFMTAIDVPAQKARALDLGAVDYVTKPIHVPEVIARVRTHLRLIALQRDLIARNEALETESTLRRDVEAQLRQSLDQAIVATDSNGTILFATRRADTLLQLYFPDRPRAVLPAAILPLLLEPPQQHAPAPKVFCHPTNAARSLSLSVFSPAHSTAARLLLLEESGAKGPAALLHLGLSNREAEVLFWIVEGKTHPEIAMILGTAIRTVHKHAENIYRKLNLENRAAAMRVGLDALSAPDSH